MQVAAAVMLLSEIVTNLPAAIQTGEQVIKLVNNGYKQLTEAIGDKDVTRAEVNALVAKIVANSAEIQSID